MIEMVIDIGIVVDEEIVVMENIKRNIEEGLKKIDEELKGMKEIKG